jgi:hypothetical protein
MEREHYLQKIIYRQTYNRNAQARIHNLIKKRKTL